LTALPGGVAQGYDPAGQLTARTGPDGSVSRYAFDAAGERVGVTAAGAGGVSSSTAYGFDRDGELTSVSGAGATYTFGYDGDGLRVAVTSGGSTAYEAWDGLSFGLPALLADGTRDYVYGPMGEAVAQVDRASGTVTYLHADRLGSVRLLTDGAGAVVGSASFSPYGSSTGSSGVASPFGFAGQYTDPTGLVYMRARYYDPASGQFLSVDPMVDATREPYGYVGGDPVNATDPSGLLGVCWSCGWAAAKGVVKGGRDFVTGTVSAVAHPSRFVDACEAGSGEYGGGFTGALACVNNLNPVTNIKNGFVNSVKYARKGCSEQSSEAFMNSWLQSEALLTPAGKLIISKLGSVEVGDIAISFGHGARHLAGTGLAADDVEAVIESSIRSSLANADSSGLFWGRVTVDGTVIEYRAYTLPDGTINVGTYYVP